MSIVAHGGEDSWQLEDKRECSLCDRKLTYPFLCWEGDTKQVCICGRCAARFKNGLMADLIQLSAIMDIKGLGHGFSGYTLQRRTWNDIERELERGAQAGCGLAEWALGRARRC